MTQDRRERREARREAGGVFRPRETFTQKMKRKIDLAIGRVHYGRRLAIAEPVFANITLLCRDINDTLRCMVGGETNGQGAEYHSDH